MDYATNEGVVSKDAVSEVYVWGSNLHADVAWA
jgi:hypothetical protein